MLAFKRKLFRLNVYLRRLSTAASTPHTIYALSSGQCRAGVAVIRISGPEASRAVREVSKVKSFPESRRVVLTKLCDPVTKEILDKGILLWFRGPNSFTGEDVCEFHVHGGAAVVNSVLSALSKIPTFRMAEPGEFTKRAFQNAKLDLTSVEGLSDLIQAETEAQRRQALRQMDGELCKLYSNWRQRIVRATAYVEAFIDFSEDENIEDGVLNIVETEVRQLLAELHNHLNDNRRGERLRNGVRVTIIGRPNVGKSSLLNYICEREAAIVSPIAGTTRDVITCAVDIAGYPVLINDTAGLHHSTDLVEKEGIKRAITTAEQADLIIVLFDAPTIKNYLDRNSERFDDYLKQHLLEMGLKNVLNETLHCNSQASNGETHRQVRRELLLVVNKMDLITDLPKLLANSRKTSELVRISCETKDGMEHLMETLKEKVQLLCGLSESPNLTSSRHRHHLMRCEEHLKSTLAFLTILDEDVTLAANQLQKAAIQLGKISGEITKEHILDVIFKEFCIGK